MEKGGFEKEGMRMEEKAEQCAVRGCTMCMLVAGSMVLSGYSCTVCLFKGCCQSDNNNKKESRKR